MTEGVESESVPAGRAPPRAGGTLGRVPFAVLTAALVVALFGVQGNAEQVAVFGRSALGWMAHRWNGSGGDLSHGWIVPLVSGYVVWRRRAALAAAPRRAWAWGLGLVAAALLLHLVGVRAQQTRLSLAALVTLLWALPLTCYGPAFARLLVFPCAYLVFCIPFSFLDGLTVSLRILATTVSTVLLNGLGIAARQSGTAIYSAAAGGFNFDVADACSGLRSLLAMTALTAAYAQFVLRGWWRQWTLFLCAVPLAIAGNVARIVAIGVVAQVWGRESAVRIYHDYSGYVVFVVATLLMIAIGRLLERVGGARESRLAEGSPASDAAASSRLEGERPREPQDARISGATRACVAAVVLLAAGTAWAAARTGALTLHDEVDVRLELPDHVGAYVAEDVRFCQRESCLKVWRRDELGPDGRCPACGGAADEVALAERRLLPADTVIRRRHYVNPRGETADVSITVSGQEQKSLHRPQQCLPAQGHVIEASRVLDVPLATGATLRAMLLELRPAGRAGRGGSAYAYWYAGEGRETPYHWQRLLWMSRARVLRQEAYRWAYVAVSTDREPGNDRHAARLREFMAGLHPALAPAPR